MKKLNVFLRRDVYYVHFQRGGKRYLRSMDTREKNIAEQRAKILFREVAEARWKNVDALRSRSEFCTVGEIIDRYQSGILGIRDATRNANVCALRRVLRKVLGSENVEVMRSDVIGPKLAREYQRLSGDASACGINSTLRQAKSLFSRRAMEIYEDLKMGDVSGFVSVPGLKEREKSYRPLTPDVVSAMQSSSEKLREDNPNLYLVFLLFSRCGLRNVEILHARKSWVEKRGELWGLAIIQRPDFAPKGREGFVPLPMEIVDLITSRADDDFLVPGHTLTERKNLIYRDHSKWVRQYIPGRTKSSYELRKHAGSIIATRSGNLLEPQTMLRHGSQTTTSKYYASLLSPIQPISHDDFSGIKPKEIQK